MDKLSKILEEAIINIREDRRLATLLLEDVVEYISGQQDRHQNVGMTASKYLENLSRTNEQIVKIAAIMKSNLNREEEISEEDKEDLYKLLENSEIKKE